MLKTFVLDMEDSTPSQQRNISIPVRLCAEWIKIGHSAVGQGACGVGNAVGIFHHDSCAVQQHLIAALIQVLSFIKIFGRACSMFPCFSVIGAFCNASCLSTLDGDDL